MRLVDGRKSKIGIMIFFFSICFFAASAGKEDPGIKISDSLTLHSGDIITLQADDNTYLQRGSFPVCEPKSTMGSLTWRESLVLTSDPHPHNPRSYFVVESVRKNEIRLRADNDRYLECYEETHSQPLLQNCIYFEYILIKKTRSDLNCMEFTVEKIKGKNDNKVALRACNGYYLKRSEKRLPIGWSREKTYNLITAEGYNSSERSAQFAVARTGIDLSYNQTVSNIEFDVANRTASTKTLLFPITVTNPTAVKITKKIAEKKSVTVTNKWIWEKGIELGVGTKFIGTLEIPGFGSGGIECSTDIKETERNTNEYSFEEIHDIDLDITLEVPPMTSIKGYIKIDKYIVDVPYKALVTVKDVNNQETYSYPISGLFVGAEVIPIETYLENQTRESLAQSATANKIAPTESQTTYIATGNDNGTYHNISDADPAIQVFDTHPEEIGDVIER